MIAFAIQVLVVAACLSTLANVPIFIGIDEANHKHINTRFHQGRGSIHYCYSSRGVKVGPNGDYIDDYLSSCRAGAIITLSFEERRNKITENITSLNQHQEQNEEAKEKSGGLLADGDKKEAEREKIIVSKCETIINSTPNLQYIETELRFTFNQLDQISRKISKFGILITQPINSGMKCIFKSTSDATNAPSSSPKIMELPTIQLKSSTFDTNKQKVKLSFKVNQKSTDINMNDINVMDYLLIYVQCSQDIDNEDEKGDEMKPIHQQTVLFKDCESYTLSPTMKPSTNYNLKL